MFGKCPRRLAQKLVGSRGSGYVLVALILLAVVGLSQGWRGGDYWTSRYSGQGVSYENWIGFWSHDSSYPAYRHHYQTYRSAYYRYPHCGACYCNTTGSTVSCSSASSVSLRGISYRFNLTKTTFLPTVTSIAIYNSGLYYSEDGAFDLLSSLGSLTLHATNLLNFPDVSLCTVLTRLDLSRNKITFPVGVDPGRLLPDNLTHLALMENNISWIPKGFFSHRKLQFLGLSNNKIKQIPANAIEHMSDLLFLSLDGNELTSLSWRTLNTLETSNVTHLNFSNNQISYVGGKAFHQLRSLKILELHNNKISTINWQAFYDLPNLLHLDLNRNNLEKLPGHAFVDLPELRTLVLHSQTSGMTTMSYEAFHNVSNLETLFISNNAFTTFPHPALSEENWPNLKHVHADHNDITNISAYSIDAFEHLSWRIHRDKEKLFSPFSTMRAVLTLYLHTNQIIGVRQGVLCPLTSLEYLDMQSNNIQEDTLNVGAFDCLISLKTINLDYNQIQLVPMANDANSFPPSIQTIYLRHNGLKYLVPGSFTNLTALSSIYLQNNELKSVVPGSFTNLPALSIIYMDNNKLTSLVSGTFTDLPSLTTLYITSNYIISIENTTFPPQIQYLYLNNNRYFDFRHHNPFNNLTRLGNLYLAGNDITDVPDTAFHGLEELTHLDVQSNRLGWLKKVALQDLHSLEHLYMQNNDIGQIEEGTIDQLTSHIKEINFNGNDLTELHPGGEFHNITASGPINFYGNRISSLRSETFKQISGVTDLDLRNNDISTIEANAFHDVSAGFIRLDNNPTKRVESFAFNDVRMTYDLSLPSAHFNTIPSFAFNQVSGRHMYLHGGSVAVIESNAFHTVRLSGDMNLQSNNISVIKENGFYKVSCGYLYLHNNPLTTLRPFAFEDLRTSYDFVMHTTKLEDIPSSAFNGVSARNLCLNNNPVTTLASFSFNNTRVSNHFSMHSCQIETIMSRAFNDVTAGTISLYNNPITRTLDSLAFTNIRVTDDFLMHSCAFSSIASRTFNDVSARNLMLYGNSKLAAIAEEAFSSVNVWSSLEGHGTLDMSNCAIRVIVGKMFTSGSRVKNLIIRNNQLRYIGSRAFEEVELLTIDISNNLLVSIPEGCFQLQPTVQKMDLTNNTISFIGNGAFDNLLSLEHLLLGENDLQVFYKLPELTRLETLDISNNKIQFVEENAFDILATNETYLYLTGNQLACSCSFYNTMSILNTTIFGGTCSTPEQLINITFESFDTSNNYFANVDSSKFLCAPRGVQASAASNREISLSWDLIPTLENIQPSVQQTNATMAGSNETGTSTTTYNQTMINTTMVNETVSNSTDFNQTETDLTNVSISNTTKLNQNEANITGVNNTGFNRTQTNETSVIDDEQPDQVDYPYYAVNCTSDTAPPINRGLIVQNSTVFDASDGVQAGTMYTCTVLYNNMGDFSASSWPVTVTTLQETEEIDVNSMQVPISYYDFSITHPDFDGRRQGELSDPTYVVNPFGGYLSTSDDPTLDSFARWFLSVPGDNYVREKTLVLKQQNGTNSYRYTNDDFFPVDGFGYGFEGQRDCNGTLHNLGFTAAIRAALTYRGNEIITVGGGDELWLFLDRERVIDLRREKGDKSETTSCRRLKLQDSRSEGGVSSGLASGTVVDGGCVIHGNVINDTQKLDLTTGNTYHLDIFVAEREPCTSSLFLEVQGVVLSFPVVDLSADVGSFFTARALNVSNGTTDSPTVTPEERNNITALPTWTPETSTPTGASYGILNHTVNNTGNYTDGRNGTANYTETTTPSLTSNHTAQQNISTNMSGAELTDSPPGFPVDYEPRIPEDLHLNGIVQTVSLSSVTSTESLFIVTILEGNDGGHFTIKNDTDDNRKDAENIPTQNLSWVTVDETSFVVCNQTVVETTAETIRTGVQSFMINTPSALITLAAAVDFEETQQHELVLVVEDNSVTPSRTGTLAIEIFVEDVNDNCPSFTTKEFDLEPRPVLSPGPVFTLQWEDRDSGSNATVSLYRTQMVQQTSTQLQFSVIAVDSGTPSRGDIATVSMAISDTCLYDSLNKSIEYDVSVENHTGNVYLRVPKYYVKPFVCFEPLGMESGCIHISQISASSVDGFYGPERARLNNNASVASDGGTSGAGGNWRAAVTNSDQWLQVSFLEEVIVKAVVVQGSFDAQEWVETYSVLHSDDGVSWQTYEENGTVKIFNGSRNATTPHQAVLLDPINTSHIRINPRSWRNRISMRIELIGCTVRMQHIRETTCARCPTTYYCTGDGVARPCGRCDPPSAACERSPTEHSFGGASECSPCPTGRICKDGYGHSCSRHHYADPCNETYCPDSCTPCEPGYACFFGRRYRCRPGFYGTGRTDYCIPCPAGSYNNHSGATGCMCCPAGSYSTVGKTECEPCHPRTWSRGDCTICRDCRDVSECPCLSNPCFGDVICQNINSSYYVCGACPPGYSGDGVTCVDIDECNITAACHDYCENTNPGYVCGACPQGYSGSTAIGYGLDYALQHPQVCEDMDECAVDNGGCHQHAECVNTLGSYRCGDCVKGYISDIYLGCIPEDLCQLGRHNCSSNATCLSLGNGKFRCKCKPGYGGDGYRCGPDTDQDGWPDEPVSCLTRWCKQDNCPLEPNSGQEDNDGDTMGDVCDLDDDNDGRLNSVDNCIFVPNWDQEDTDGDGYGDVCDTCPLVTNEDQTDTDGDGSGDECDDDDDGDGVLDMSDPCPLLNDTLSDADGDCVGDAFDNCPNISNANQQDSDMDGYGDACDGSDKDGDSVIDTVDNCLDIPNAEQTDTDSDGIGDACDDDIDNDAMPNDRDNCPYIPNPGWDDTNGNHVGDACEYDYDGDGVPDVDDVCPKHSNYHVTSFTRHVSVNLAGGAAPTWGVVDDGREIRLITHTEDPVVLIGNDRFGPVNLTGTMFVNEDSGNDYIGFVFGYQSNRKFYVVIWKHENENAESSATYGGIKGLQIKIVDSSSGPSPTLADALWHTHDTTDHVTMLWHDPDMRGWIHRTPYTFQLMHRPSVGLIRVTVSSNWRLLTDSGDVYDTTILGGRLGVFQYNQTGVVWSNLQIACGEKVNQAIHFDGKDDYVELTSVIALELDDSFTIESWIRLTGEDTDVRMPVICTLDNRLCLFLENGFLYGKLGTSVVQSNTDIPTEYWCHVTLLYDAQGCQLSLYINGSLEASASGVMPLEWNGNDTNVYIGRNEDNFFNGTMDDIRLYGIKLLEAEISEDVRTSDRLRQFHRGFLNAQFTVDNEKMDATKLLDVGIHGHHGKIVGSPLLVPSAVDQARHQLPSARKKRRRSVAPDIPTQDRHTEL